MRGLISLQLTPDQEKFWPPIADAIRARAKDRESRIAAAAARRAPKYAIVVSWNLARQLHEAVDAGCVHGPTGGFLESAAEPRAAHSPRMALPKRASLGAIRFPRDVPGHSRACSALIFAGSAGAVAYRPSNSTQGRDKQASQIAAYQLG
jgi:hypothetical protein